MISSRSICRYRYLYAHEKAGIPIVVVSVRGIVYDMTVPTVYPTLLTVLQNKKALGIRNSLIVT
jgi:hypothetical protein